MDVAVEPCFLLGHQTKLSPPLASPSGAKCGWKIADRRCYQPYANGAIKSSQVLAWIGPVKVIYASWLAGQLCIRGDTHAFLPPRSTFAGAHPAPLLGLRWEKKSFIGSVYCNASKHYPVLSFGPTFLPGRASANGASVSYMLGFLFTW